MTVDDLGADEPRGEVPPVTAELDLAAEGLAAGGPMVGIAIRLPAATLDAARLIAHEEGIKVTAMLREWIDQRVAERVDDARVVSVGDLRRLIAHRAQDLGSGRAVGGDEPSPVGTAPVRTSSAGTGPKAAAAPKVAAAPAPEGAAEVAPKAAAGPAPKVADPITSKAAASGRSKGKSSGGAKPKAKAKGKSKSGHGSGKSGAKAG